MINTIKGKLLTILLSFIFISGFTAIIAFKYFVESRDALSDFVHGTENINVLLLQDINTIHEFFENETINPAFFYSGKSKLVQSHHKICKHIEAALSNIKQKQIEFTLSDSLKKLHKNFLDYTKATENVIAQILQRGFKDFGVEGKMREYAHLLEDYSNEIGMINVLQLRRHEKDFIIRQEDEYVKKHLLLISDLQNSITINQKISLEKKRVILNLLNNYSEQFQSLVFYERKIGLRKYGGLKLQIDNNSIKILSSLAFLVQTSKDKVGVAIFKMELFYLAVGLIFILISVISAFIISKKIISRNFGFKKQNSTVC